MPKDRDAEQGDVAWLWCWWQRKRAAAWSLSRWIGVGDSSDFQHLQAQQAVRLEETANFQLCGPEKLTGRRIEVQSKESSMARWSAAWSLGWWRLKRGGA